jgi:hypothetical protein
MPGDPHQHSIRLDYQAPSPKQLVTLLKTVECREQLAARDRDEISLLTQACNFQLCFFSFDRTRHPETVQIIGVSLLTRIVTNKGCLREIW